LSARGRTLGALSVLRFQGSTVYHSDDMRLVEELARRAAMAFDNARLYSERAHIAHTLQTSLLPPQLPEIPGVEIRARYRPGGSGIATEVGGDFYDVFSTQDGWAVVIGDVCGKGPEAAALTALMRYTIRASAMHSDSPSGILSLLNDAILREQVDGRFCTAIYALLRPDGDGLTVCLCRAGHPPPLLVCESGNVASVGATGSLLGVDEEPKLLVEEIEIRPGQTLVLYTDGVTDAAAPQRVLDAEDLVELVRPWTGLDPAELVERIEHAVLAGREETRDDIALVALAAR
jgi:serine phosphatase RsbU (regulator of sigma subunit)